MGGPRGRAAGDIEDLASKLYCRRADSDFACRDWSDRGTAPKHRNAECKSGRCIQRHPAECDDGPDKCRRRVSSPGHRDEIRYRIIG